MFSVLTAIRLTTNVTTNNGSGEACMAIYGQNEAYGPVESEGEIDSVNQSFLYLVMQVL